MPRHLPVSSDLWAKVHLLGIVGPRDHPAVDHLEVDRVYPLVDENVRDVAPSLSLRLQPLRVDDAAPAPAPAFRSVDRVTCD